uniref:MARVEL domain-containing protein n=1 Tax=Panagrellus redivivus TaxID=6233 RepID=A0A7E4V2J3_PANRE
MSDRICGCNALTAAGIVTSLQTVILVMALSSTGIILDRYRLWTSDTNFYVNNTVATTMQPGTHNIPTKWSQAWVELAMAWYVAFACFWLFSLFIVCLSFKYYRPVFVLPNFIALIVGIFMNAFGFAVLLGRLLDVNKTYRTDGYEDAMIIYVMAFLLFVFIINFLFIFCMNHYHKYLQLRYGTQIPKFIQTRNMPPPRTQQTNYAEDY